VIDFDNKDPYSPTVNNINKNKSVDEDLDHDESVTSFDRLLGFDVCGSFSNVTSVCGIFSSPAPVIFKARPCYECGRNCNKIGGYTTEIVEKKTKPTSGGEKQSPAVEMVETKVYYHKWCLQIKEWRTEHAKTYHTVMVDLRKHVRNKNVYVALVRRARVRRREKDLKTRQNVASVDKENKMKLRVVKHASIFSGFSFKKKSAGNSKTQNTEGPVKRDLTEEKKKNGSLMKRGNNLTLFSLKKETARNSDTQNTEASDKDDHGNKKKKNGSSIKRGKNLTLFSLKKETARNSSTQNTEGPDKDDHTNKKIKNESLMKHGKNRSFFPGKKKNNDTRNSNTQNSEGPGKSDLTNKNKNKNNGSSMKVAKNLSLFSVKKKTGMNSDNQNTRGPAKSSDLKNEKKKNGSLTKRAKNRSLFSVKKKSARNSNTQNREGPVKSDRTIEKKQNTTKSANKKVKVASSVKTKKNDKQQIKPRTSKKKGQSRFVSRATKKNKLNVSSKNKNTNSKVNRQVEKPAAKKKKFSLFRSKGRTEC